MQRQKQVLIPKGHWTPFRNEIFKNKIELKTKYAASLYVLMYDRAYHNLSGPMHRASIGDLAKHANLDLDEVKAGTKELRRKKLVQLHQHDSPKPVWEVPLAIVDLSAGNWFAVPRFLIQKYIPAYPDSVLLLLLLWFQNWRWSNDVYPGIPTLGERLTWTDKRIEQAIFTMSKKNEWGSLNVDLPRPLDLWTERWRNSDVNHYRVRAMRYDEKRQTVRLSKYWAKTFKVPSVAPENRR